MKNLVYSSISLVLMGIMFMSCNNEEIIQPPHSNNYISESIQINSDGKKLIFLTSEDYERFISSSTITNNETLSNKSLEKSKSTKLDIKFELSSQDYISYSKYIAENNLENLIKDEILSEILNQDQIVQIGKFLYKLNLIEEKVYVLPAKYDSQYSDLVIENINNKNILVFSTSDEVIKIIENGDPKSNKKIGCSSRKANYKSNTTNIKTINSNANMSATSRYEKYGIMFKLEADVNIFDSNSWSDLRVYIAFENCSYKQRCGNSLNNYSYPWKTPSVMSTSSLTKLYRVTLYSSLKKLENYTWKIRGRVEDWTPPVAPNPWNNPYTVVFSDWALIYDY
ncbi:hypothetical protein V1T75_14850 [Tenacibaculum sp. FZY0031]|uniref:hypothetical protein n=1 Tax=Tenacibaculum sp. FZY0031 TaxID=3116648 RepID=UPI002EBF0BD3|nr:hypothetical protein [Tenacibaculum sp. FZY0031]